MMIDRATHLRRLWLLLGILTAFALRLFQLGQDSLWYDETVSVVLARKSIPDLIAHTAGDIHPPGYYLLLHGWQLITHPTLNHGLEYLFAWPSLFFGLLIVVLLYPIGCQLFSPATARWALWLAAIHPYQIWYSQEVRMYTLGAALGLLCLWALINDLRSADQRHQHPTMPTTKYQWWARAYQRVKWLILYAIVGAMGLYTLYYFLFVLIALNLITIADLFPHNLGSNSQPRGPRRISRISHGWAGAQLLLLLLWSPWLPIFWRQATTPPVPPWRVPWDSLQTLVAALSESSSALLLGQSAPWPTHWLWLVIGIVGWFAFLIGYANRPTQRRGALIGLVYVFIPLLLIYGMTTVGTPLYHVRYLVIYAPPLLLLLADGLQALYHRFSRVALLLPLLLITANGWSLHTFWSAARFQSDDHRAAVAQLAAGWRPGDLIVVNAGWVYTALEVYWPTALIGPDAAVPPPLTQITRLTDYANKPYNEPSPQTQPVAVRTGSIEGAATLGWGDPASDFFAISTAQTVTALDHLSDNNQRIWHYRLYDTVNDSSAVIRTWLAANGTQLLDQPFSGRDFLRLQLYELHQQPRPPTDPTTPEQAPSSPSALRLDAAALLSPTLAAGQTLYVQSHWWHEPGTGQPLPVDVRFSLRVYDDQARLLAQHDETPLVPVLAWPSGEMVNLPLALPIAVATAPGTYTVKLVVYDGKNGDPLTLSMADQVAQQMITLGQITLTAPLQPPELTARLVGFDYIDLISATVVLDRRADADDLALNLVWQPQPSPYQETYVAQWTLVDEKGLVLGTWEDALGGWAYPSGQWPASIPVRQRTTLTLAQRLPPGHYQIDMTVRRHSDGQVIPATLAWWHSASHYRVGNIAVESISVNLTVVSSQ